MRLHPLILILLAVAIFLCGIMCRDFFVSASAPPQHKYINLAISDGDVCVVRSVIDGDTVVLENGLHLRYNGMNAPETGRWVKDYSPISKEATARNIELVEGKRIRVKLASDPIDMHGRIVANVFLVPENPSEPEREVREFMLKEGFAKVMGVGVSAEEYKTLKSWQDEARQKELGLWGVKNLPKPPPEEAPPFCASSSSKSNIYHANSCNIAKRLSPAGRHDYASAEEAEAVGLKPCPHCVGKR